MTAMQLAVFGIATRTGFPFCRQALERELSSVAYTCASALSRPAGDR